ncbi:zinc finger protein 26-like [Osmia bicornis bicornis]|uniref:zinc finger protein 26-like n=1 Tax=Osmia bicornis bicornis TaxID=1437191 RepID=UPI001EAECE99|nr:zinc finger protein 26-like [Osmia bicornis bicornis]XP_029039602.2 zinc finger protein 26-like [Osmia bicornis bicornis]XP_029039603.2 zinc finger protein 26-like [Osmia bicornis bicornis]
MDAVEINTSDSSQNEEGIVSTVEICRVCLLGNLVMRDLFLENEVDSLSAKAMSFANVKMLPGDGLPSRVCCMCADKLESAYEFKLQVEQADTVLRERFVTMNIKEELFFNEVEVHLDAGERNEGIGEIHIDNHYQNSTGSLAPMSQEEKSSLLKDQLALLQVEKLTENEQAMREQNNGQAMEEVIDQTITTEQTSEDCLNHEEEAVKAIAEAAKGDDEILKHQSRDNNYIERIPPMEHDYILQQECILSNDGQQEQQEQQQQQQQQLNDSEESFPREDCAEYVNLLVKAADVTSQEDEDEEEQEEPDDAKMDIKIEEHSLCQNETRRSKRKLARRSFDAKQNSDEENYFENLNLSSRLKTVEPSDKSDKVFFLCYLCDKEFLSKSVLKEHMHSHEEVRKALSLKKPSETPEKSVCNVAKSPPSGKRSNKCPYCGKQYIYIISYSKHLKKHEREKEEGKEDPMPLEISFHEDEHSLDLEDYEDAQHSNSECRKRAKRKDSFARTKTKKIEDDDDDEDEEHGQDEDEDEEGENREEKGSNSIREEEQENQSMETFPFACDKCSQKFHTKRGLRKHSVSHVVLKCSICEEEFDSMEKLRNHRAKHVVEGVLSEQDFEADTTEYTIDKESGDYGTARKESGERMEDEEGGEAGRVELENGSGKSDRNTETQGHEYSCKACCQRFARKDLLLKHVEQQHERVKSFKCTQCNKTFGNELTLRNHLIATNHKTFLHGQEYDPNKRIKRVAARAAQKIIDKIKTEDGLEDYDEEDEEEDNNVRSDRVGSMDGNYGRGKRDTSQKKHNNKKELECVSCNKKCCSKQSLAKHMEQHVKDERVVKLEKQKQPTEKKGQRNCASDDVDGEKKDDDYDSDFESGLDWPMDNHECAKCKKRYSTKKSLLRHQLLHEEPNFECDICNVKFYRKDKLKAHYDKCSEKNPDQVRKCNICGDSFENNEILREHRSKHVTEGILTEEDLRDIEPRPEEKKPGEKIGRKRRTDIVGLECTECNKQYTSRKGLLRHIQVHEGKKYLCDICPKKFYRREHLKIHVAKHNMIKPYKCTRCTKRFIKEEQLTNHLSKHDRTFKKNKETDSSKRFLCEICSKSFTQSTTLIAHLRAHNGIKPYVCEVCSRPFTTNAYLKMHMRTHTQERPYICQYCSRAFARADTLANHLTSHTGEAKYHCKYCPKNFRRLKSLKEHVFIHTGQRPYACPTCDRRFNNNGSRYAHSKRCKQNFVQNQNRGQVLTTQAQSIQTQQKVLQQATLGQCQVVKAQNIKTITITRQSEPITAQQVMQHQEILMPLILPLTVTLADVGEEVILPEGSKIFTTT